MRKKIVAGNWKMNRDAAGARALAVELMHANVSAGTTVVVMPPFIYLSEMSLVPRAKGISLGAQHSYHESEGAFTGEISAYMLRSLGVDYCLVGHSERRKFFHESDADCLLKVKAILAQQMVPVLCVGEELELRENNQHFEHVGQQLKQVLNGLTASEISRMVIAYEPVWAIGTGKTATIEQASEMHTYIRQLIAQQSGENVAAAVHILYGGSVNENNAKELMCAKDIDGVLVGGASLKADSFHKIIAAAG